jgi:signal transduction histidine kinase
MKQIFDKKGTFVFGISVALASIGFWVLYSLYDFLSLNQQISFLFFNEPLQFSDALLFNVSYFSFLTRVLVISIFILAALAIRKTISSLHEKNQELVEIQEKIQHNELLYRMLFDTNNDPILMVKNWNVYKCNRKALSFFGYKSKDSLLSESFLNLFPETQEDGSSTKARILDIQKQIHTQNFDIPSLSLVCKTSNDKHKPVIVTISPFVLDKTLFCQVLLRDVSIQRIYENEVLSSRTKATTASQEKNQLISILNHELNPPLELLSTSLQQLLTQSKEASLQPYIDTLQKAQESLQNLSKNMELYGTVETTKVSFQKEPVQLHNLKEELEKEYTPLFQKKDIQFSVRCDEEDYCLILDRQKFYQITDSILHNALHHTAPSGTVNVHIRLVDILQSASPGQPVTEETQCTLLWDITDSSKGIPELLGAQPFPLEENSSSDIPKNSRANDLNLNLAAKFIAVYRGTLLFQNKPNNGKGCVFTARIPHIPLLLYSTPEHSSLPISHVNPIIE